MTLNRKDFPTNCNMNLQGYVASLSADKELYISSKDGERWLKVEGCSSDSVAMFHLLVHAYDNPTEESLFDSELVKLSHSIVERLSV